MKTVRIEIATMSETSMPLCPYCGGEPLVEVEVKKEHFRSDRVINHEIICPYCGFSASWNIWWAISSAINMPVAPNTEDSNG